MNIFFVILLLFQVFYMTSCIHNTGPKKKIFFRKDYRFFESRQSFYKFHTAHRHWLDAKKRCALEGATMWYPEDQAEVDLMVEYWKETQPDGFKMHMGLSDLLSEGIWETVDGKPVVYQKWYPGEPNNAFGGENCAVMRRDFSKKGSIDINDESCGFVQPFICKKTLVSLDWNDLCDMPDLTYVYDGSLGKCYKFHNTPVSWTEAHSTCVTEQSYLAVINSEKEKDFLVKLTADAKKPPRFVHLGIHNRLDEEWMTVQGSRLADSGWTVWAPNQPDGDNQLCGVMGLDGLYNKITCDQKAVFICEHDVSKLTNS